MNVLKIYINIVELEFLIYWDIMRNKIINVGWIYRVGFECYVKYLGRYFVDGVYLGKIIFVRVLVSFGLVWFSKIVGN